MKKFLYTSIAILLIGSCKPKDKEKDPDPTATASISLTAVHSEFHYSDSWTTKYYTGDTIRYTVNVSSSNDVSSYTASVNGVNKSNVSSFINPKSFSQNFEYVITQTPGQNVEIVFEVTESGNLKTTKTVSFTVTDLLSYTNFRFFNKESIDKADSLGVVLKFPTEESGSNYHDVALLYFYDSNADDAAYRTFLTTSRNMYNPGNTSKVFLKRLYTYHSNPAGVFLKCSGVNYEDFTTPNSIIKYYKNNVANVSVLQNSRMYIDNIQVGDIYIVSYDFGPLTGADTYAILKITNIVDDGLTSDDLGGNDNDYIQLDIKLFGTSRF